jgi:hypothetical protein
MWAALWRLGKANGAGEDDKWALQNFEFNRFSPAPNFKLRKLALPGPPKFMKHFEGTKQITGNNFPFGIYFKIETDFELTNSGTNWIFNLVEILTGFKPYWKNPRNSPKLYLGMIFVKMNLY